MGGDSLSGDDELVIKVRGLPFRATKDDLILFFSDCKIQNEVEGVHLVIGSDERATGEAYIEPKFQDDVDSFLQKDRKSMGHRWIEVFKVKRSEMEWYLRRERLPPPPPPSNPYTSEGSTQIDSDNFLRLRGLPFECTTEDIHNFFQGLEIGTVQLMIDNSGRSSGEAYVEFKTSGGADSGLLRDRQTIAHRYIEVFRVGPSEMRTLQEMSNGGGPSRGGGERSFHSSRPTPYSRNGSGGPGRDSRYGYYSTNSNSNSSSSSSFRPPARNSYSSKGGGFDEDFSPPSFRGNSSSYRSGGGGGSANCVLMRGLPFRADERNIRDFFDPLEVSEVDIIYDSSGRPSGTAKVQFSNGNDVTRAMAKHKERMDHRYIELFVHSMN